MRDAMRRYRRECSLPSGTLRCERCERGCSHLVLVGDGRFVCGACLGFLGRFEFRTLAIREATGKAPDKEE